MKFLSWLMILCHPKAAGGVGFSVFAAVLAMALLDFSAAALASGPEFHGELITEFHYSRLRDEGLPASFPGGEDYQGDTSLVLKASGGNERSRYDLEINGSAGELTLNPERITLTFLENNYLIEAGKRSWFWGKGFSASPTCPLEKDEPLWGGELSLYASANRHLLFGGALDENGSKVTGWLRTGSFLETSDYELILSVSAAPESPPLVRAGFEYSRDFMGGLTFHGGAALQYISPGEVSGGFLLGWEYLLGGYCLVTEFWQAPGELSSRYAAVAVNNFSALFSDWQWQWSDYINLTDGGHIISCEVSWFMIEGLTPGFKVTGFWGPEGSEVRSNPAAWTLAANIRCRL